jgi:hypothetical protein
MSDQDRRLMTAHRFTTRHRLPKLIVLVTIFFWLAITATAVACPLVFKLTIPVSALGQKVEPGFQSPQLNFCGPAEAIYVGDRIPLAHTQTCSPVRWAITIPKPVSLVAASPPAAKASKAPGRGHFAPNRPTPATRVIAERQQAVSKAIKSSTTSIMMWLIVWLVIPGAIECLVAAGIGVLVLNYARGQLLGSRYSARASRRFVIGTMAVWLIFGMLTVIGSTGLAKATTLDQVFGTTISQQDPPAIGPRDITSVGASIGNSLVAVYGGPGSKGYCFQSQDSLAILLTNALQVPVRNLACSAATVTQGLLGPQPDGDPKWKTNAQVGYLKQIANLKFVILTDGQDELQWSQLTGVCYLQDSCSNGLSHADFEMRLTSFAIQYSNLLQALQALPTHPKVLVNLSYDPFSPQAVNVGASCPALGQLTAKDVKTLVSENDQLNHVLSVGAAEYGFKTATPHLTPLCGSGVQDIQPVWSANGTFNKYAFHPLVPGEYAIAFADYSILNEWVSSGSS